MFEALPTAMLKLPMLLCSAALWAFLGPSPPKIGAPVVKSPDIHARLAADAARMFPPRLLSRPRPELGSRAFCTCTQGLSTVFFSEST